MLKTLLANPVALMFLIIVAGTLLGRVRIARISLGSSAVLFAALTFGQLGWIASEAIGELKVLGDFGVVLFVYAIGLQAGPRFVRVVRQKGTTPLVVAAVTVVSGVAVAVLLGRALGLSTPMIVGAFSGALTSTPALAAATEVSDNPLVSVAYGVAYPFGVVGVVVFAQLMPRWLAGRARLNDRQPDLPAAAPLLQRCYQVQNPACVGKRMNELRLHDIASVNISRVLRGTDVLALTTDLRLQVGDVVMAVGAGSDLDRLALVIGPPVPVEVEMRDVPNVVARDIYISEAHFAGKTLRELHVRSKFGVVITRVRREEVEFVPRGEFMLEIGDQVRVVGYEPDVAAFQTSAGMHESRIHETGIPAFAVGLALGLILGFTPLPVPGVGEIKLGLAGGPLFVGLLLGHFGRIGKLRVHVPLGARHLMRELGLVLFLASAGASAGTDLMATIKAEGAALLVLSIACVLVALAVGFISSYVFLRQSLPSSLGLTCGAMTSTPGLGAAGAQFDTDTPALSYAAVYPLALVAMTIAAQLLVSFL